MRSILRLSQDLQEGLPQVLETTWGDKTPAFTIDGEPFLLLHEDISSTAFKIMLKHFRSFLLSMATWGLAVNTSLIGTSYTATRMIGGLKLLFAQPKLCSSCQRHHER